MVKMYPKGSLTKISTTSDCGCKECGEAIPMREEHWVGPGGVHFHDKCAPKEESKVKVVDTGDKQQKLTEDN